MTVTESRATKPVLTILFDGMMPDDIAKMLVDQLGADKATRVFWNMAQHLPVLCTTSCDKQEIVDALENNSEGWDIESGLDATYELDCTDEALAMLMHRVGQSSWERTHETPLEAIMAELYEAKLVKLVKRKEAS